MGSPFRQVSQLLNHFSHFFDLNFHMLHLSNCLSMNMSLLFVDDDLAFTDLSLYRFHLLSTMLDLN